MAVLVEAQHINRSQQVFPVNCLPLLYLTLLACLAGDEGNKLGNTLLDCFLCIFGDLRIFGQSFLHYSADVGDGQKSRIVRGSKFINVYPSAWLLTSLISPIIYYCIQHLPKLAIYKQHRIKIKVYDRHLIKTMKAQKMRSYLSLKIKTDALFIWLRLHSLAC